MKKRITSILCALLLLASGFPSALALSGERQRSADTLYTLGLIQDSGGLSDPATRAEAAALLVRLSGREREAKELSWLSGFLDVPQELAYIVDYAHRQGWITGYNMAAFRPENGVSANSWCALLLRMLGYTEKAGDFAFEEASLFARRIGLTNALYEGPLDRGELLDIARGALSFRYKDSGDTVASRLAELGDASRSALNALGYLTPELSAREAADRCAAAVFQLNSYQKESPMQSSLPDKNASGFFIDPSGIAVTNYHSIQGALQSVAVLATGEEYELERVLYYDPDADIAVCKISTVERNSKKVTSAFANVELAGTAELRMGDQVYSIGSPLGLGLSVSEGIVGDPARVVSDYKLPGILNSADISTGSSGGALLNARGQAVGVTSGAFAHGNSMYLAVPVDPVMTADLSGEGWTLREILDLEKDKQ